VKSTKPLALNDAALRIANWREQKGFVTPSTIDHYREWKASDADLMLGKLMLVTSEVAEAAEAVRQGDLPNFVEEIADACIRLLDICGSMGIDIEGAIRTKMALNEARPVRHGKRTQL
jgi:NTP pyrophosphatase (non-canonical NTP hydrolase)